MINKPIIPMKFVLGVVVIVTLVYGQPVHYLSDDFINHLNQQDLPWKAGRNFPEHLTKEDITKKFGRPYTKGEIRKPFHNADYLTNKSLLIPPEFDSRVHFKECADIISIIPDQGACEASYAFNLPQVASDRFCIHSKGKIKVQLSAEYLTACCNYCRDDFETKVCTVGPTSPAWLFMRRNGLVTGGGYKSNIGCQPVSFPKCYRTSEKISSMPSCDSLELPFPKCYHNCTNKDYHRDFYDDKYRVSDFYTLDDIEHIQREIIVNGPVAAKMDMLSDFLNYKSGVYIVSPGENEYLGNIAVRIIGWGVEELPYWLVSSTFGEQFGDKGLFKIARGNNEASIEEEFVSGVLPQGKF